MDFAGPGQITASRAYFEAVSWLDAAYAALFQHLGASNDKHGRPHELYSVTPNDAVLEKLRLDLGGIAPEASETEEVVVARQSKQPDRSAAAIDKSSPVAAEKSAGRRRWLVPVAALAGAAALGYVAMVPNTAVVNSRSAEGKASAATTPTSSAAQPVAATTPGRAADASGSDTGGLRPQEVKPSAAPVSAPEAANSTATAPGGTSSRPSVGARDPAPSTGMKSDATAATREASDENASPALPTPAPPTRAASPPRPSVTNANVETQRKAAETPAVPVAASGASAPSGPPAASSASAPASARCRHILEKVQVGEPLSQDEKKELASSCR
jgi:hypothetical protein